MGLATPIDAPVLVASGWSDVTIEPADGLCDYSIDGSDGVESV
jgi:hypothetical protein